MQIKLEIVRATNIALLDQHGCKGSLFVRYYLSKKIAVNSKEVEASTDPQWGETFSLECEGKGVDEMESKSVVFEVRWRRRRRRGVFNGGLKSKLLGRVEISWEELLSYPGLSINKWFPLAEKTSLALTSDGHGLSLRTSALQIAVSITWIEPIKMMMSNSKSKLVNYSSFSIINVMLFGRLLMICSVIVRRKEKCGEAGKADGKGGVWVWRTRVQSSSGSPSIVMETCFV